MKKSVTKRVKITRTGKIIRRHMGLSHNGSRHPAGQQRRRQQKESFFSSDKKLIIKDMIRA